jgi:hypothetical protein
MIDEMTELQCEYDDLLGRLNAGELSLDEAHRIQVIEDRVAAQYGYEWAQQYLRG